MSNIVSTSARIQNIVHHECFITTPLNLQTFFRPRALSQARLVSERVPDGGAVEPQPLGVRSQPRYGARQPARFGKTARGLDTL